MLKQVFAVLIAAMAIAIMSCDKSATEPKETLETPTISITPDTAKIHVTWDTIPGATSYNVYWAKTAGVTTSSNFFDNIVLTFCIHKELANGVTYYYRVLAEGDNVISSPLSEEKSGMPISAVIYPPENFTATGGDTMDTLSWEKSSGASNYSIYWATTAGVTDSSNVIDSIESVAYTHTGLTNGIKYYYRIAAKDDIGNASALSDEISATPVSSVATPQNLTATPGNGFVLLNIDKYTGDEKASFRIYWATTAGVTTSSDTVVDQGGKGISFPYTQTGLKNGTIYYYRTLAIVSGKESGLSNEASATPDSSIALDPPKLKATKGNAQVTLEWNDVVGAAKYTIFWATDSNVTDQSNSIPVTGKPYYEHTGLINFTTYYYRVNAVDASGTASDLSTEVSATPDTVVSDLVPKNVVATAGAEQVTISWDEVTGADAMMIYWSTEPNFTKPEGTIKDEVVSPYTHSPLPSGTTYYYRVVAWDGKNMYESDEVNATPTE